MRIIDKNHDFYDYLQDPTDNSIIFDRRGSFLLEKSHICDKIYTDNYGINNQYRFIFKVLEPLKSQWKSFIEYHSEKYGRWKRLF